MIDLVGRYAVIPATVRHKRGIGNLRLDLFDSNCLSFRLSDGVEFAVRREGLQALLDAYDEARDLVVEEPER